MIFTVRHVWTGCAAAVLSLAVVSVAAPLRVGILQGTGTGSRYWHTSMHPGAAAIAGMLANPALANLGNPVIPPQGFTVTLFGPDSVQCSGNGCGPTSDQVNAFIAALDTLDVVVVMNLVDIGTRISSTVHRARLAAYWKTKGVVSLHQSNDQFGSWSDWLLLNVTRFRDAPPAHMEATVRVDTLGSGGTHPDREFLNLGLPSSARFHEEWFNFQHGGEVIRAGAYSFDSIQAGVHPQVVVTTTLDESTYGAPVESRYTMGGDHPLSWYRKFPGGGRFFYSALGHRAQTFDSVPFFRRHLYNAILWAGGHDVTASIRGDGYPRPPDAARITVSGSTLTVSSLTDGALAVAIRSLDGRGPQLWQGKGRVEHHFRNLTPGVHVVLVETSGGRVARRIAVP